MGAFDGLYDDILNGKNGAIPENAERSFSGELAAGLKAGVSVELPKMVGQAIKAVSDPGGGVHDFGQGLVEGAEERYKADPAAYAKSAYGADKSDYNPLKYVYDAASMTPASVAGAAAAIPLAVAGAPGAVVAGAGMLASGGLFGASQYQDTYERAKAAGLSEQEAHEAGLKTGLIEGGGEAVANLIPMNFLAKPFAKIAGKGAVKATERGIVKSILGAGPFAKELGKATLKELPVEMGTEFGQGAMQAQIEKDAGIRPDADWYQEGLQGAMAASMMTGGHMAAAGAGGAVRHRMTMNALTNPATNPEARIRAMEEVGKRIDAIDPAKGQYWRLNSVNAIRDGKPIPLDDSFLSDLTPRAIPVEDVDMLTGRQMSAPQLPYYPMGNLPAVNGEPGVTPPPADFIDAGFTDLGSQSKIPGAGRMALPLLPNEQEQLDQWFLNKGALTQPQNLGGGDQAMLNDMIAARYGIAPGLEGAHDAATSPLNDHNDPTEAQIQAGNYRKGHVNIQGLDISIENPAGSVRSGKDPDGKPWSTDIQHHYGYIKGTVGKDKDHIDTFIGNNPESDRVFIVDQIDPKTGTFDGHKVMIGFNSQDEATMGYLRNYDDSGPSRVGAVTEMSMQDFKTWLKEGNTKKAVGQLKERADVEEGEDGVLPGETAAEGNQGGAETPEEVSEPEVQSVDGREGDALPVLRSADDVTADELQEKNIKHDVNGDGEIIVMKAGNNIAIRNKATKKWTVHEENLQKENIVVAGLTMREALEELEGMREPEKEEPETPEKEEAVKEEETPEAKPGEPQEPELTLEQARKSEHWRGALEEAKRDAIGEGIAVLRVVEPEKKADKMKPKGATWTPEEFDQLLKAKAEDAKAKPYTVFEPQGMSREELNTWLDNRALELVKKRIADEKKPELKKKEAPKGNLGTLDNINTPELAMEFAVKLADYVSKGESMDKIKVLQMVAELYGTTVKEIREKLEAQEADWRHVEEAMEYAVVKYARAITSSSKTADEKLTQLQKLYNAQPNLAKRDTNTKAGQQFSTPAPLAFLMSEAIGVTKDDKVYEPTAGNGMLLIKADKGKVTANEYDAVRRANLEDQGFGKVTGNDILDQSINQGLSDKSQDVIVANPPFGKAEDEVVFDGIPLTKKEHIIVADALEKMKNDGRAAFIIGGHNFKSGRMGEADWNFLNWLYKHYNVRHNIDINGDVYRKMGTTYPIRLIVVDGRKATPDADYSVQDLEANTDKEAFSMSEANTFEDVRDIIQGGKNVNSEGQGASGGDDRAVSEDEKAGLQEGDNGDAGVPPTPDRDNDSGRRGPDGDSGRIGGDTAGGKPGSNRKDRKKAPKDSGGRLDSGDKSKRVDKLTGDLKTDINNALANVDAAIKAALKGVTNPNKLSMGLTVDEETYAEIKKHLAAALEDLKKAFKDFNELIAAFAQQVIERYGDAIIPYATRFYTEVHAEHTANENKKEEPKNEPAPEAGDNSLQVAYKAKSKGRSSGKLIPRNMEAFVRAALDELEERHGDIDEYVASKLQYPSREALYKSFYADQIDTVAMAIDNIDRGLGFINGSQTGAGKGRTVAAIIWYAKIKGLKSVFFTEQPKLFTDMYRDLTGIGHPEIKPYIIQGTSDAHIVDEEGNIVIRAYPPGKSSRADEYRRVALNPEQELAGYDTVFITYSQVNQPRTQNEIIRAIAGNSIIILDESHKAAGEESNTGVFMQEILAQAQGVMYSSATFAKRPSSMPVYFRTNLGQTGMNMQDLVKAVEAGGVPLQQIISAQLARSGQYIRFEMDVSQIKSFEVSTSEATKQEDGEAADAVTNVLSDFVELSYLVAQYAEQLSDRMNVGRKRGNRISVTTTSFHSVAHNVVAQLLLGLKVKVVADKVIEGLQKNEEYPEGRKILVNLANTMGSFIEDEAKRADVKSGDELDLSFNDLLRRQMRNLLSYNIKRPGMRNGERVYLEPNQLPGALKAMHDRIMRKIDTLDVNIPASPIDMIRQRIEDAGYKVGEITGRKSRLDYSEGTTIYRSMKKAERDRNGLVNGFNKGEIDVIIFNAAGSTGLSLHASEDFKDRRPRKMFIAQADLNIDTVMQAMGRIFRTGQIEKPEYEQVLTALPAEIRPAAVLQKKLKSMNANTSANADSAYANKEVPDMLNMYGDRVAAEYLLENPDINRLLGNIVWRNDDGEIGGTEDAMTKMTGRMALMPVALQEKIYNELVEVYTAEIDYLTRTGQNRLIATVHDLQAKTVEESVIYDGEEGSPNPFVRPANLERMITKITKKPYSREEVKEMADEVLAGRTQQEYAKEVSKEILDRTREYLELLNRDLGEALDNGEPTANIERKIATIRENIATFQGFMRMFAVGDPYTIITSKDGDSVLGVFLGVNFGKTAEGSNPMVPSKITFKFAVANGERTISIPMSKQDLLVQADEEPLSKMDRWNDLGTQSKETRYMVTGNLLTGYQAFVSQGKKPEVVMYTTETGETQPGILVPKSLEKELATVFRNTVTGHEAAKAYLEHMQNVNPDLAYVNMTTSDAVVIRWDRSMGKWRVVVDNSPHNNQAVMDRRLLGVTDAGRFDQNNGDWFAVVSPENLARALSVMESVFGAKFNVPREFMNRQGQEGATDLSIGGIRRKLNPSSLSRIKSAIERILPPGVKLELAEKLEYDLDQVEAGAKAHGIDLTAIKASGKRYKMRARGSAQTIRLSTGELTSLIKLSMQMAGEETGYHEILHAAEALGILKADDLKILERAFPEANGKSSKEMRADAFGDYIVGKREKIPTPVQLVFQKIKRFLERLKNVLQGLGYRTAEDVFDDLFSGKLKRESGVRGVRQSELTAPYKAAEGQTEYSFVTDSLKAVERAIRDAQSTSKVASFATSAIDRAKEIAGRMGPLGALPEQNEYLAQRYRTLGNIDAGEELARKMHDALQKVSDEDAKAIYEFWTNPGMNVKQAGIKDVNAQKAALEVKKKIVDIGRELVERDLLDEKTYMENLGRYVPRVYLKHILGEQGFKAMGTGRKASIMAYLKKRKDIPEEVRRLLLGEIKDPAYLAARSISVPLRDMAILDWLGDIAKNGKWVLPESLVEWTFPANGKAKKVTPYWLMSEAKRLREQIHHMPEADRAEAKALADRMQSEGEAALAGIEGLVPDDYKQIPDSPRFGALRGMYVRKEIHQDLIGTTTIFAGDASIAEKFLGQGGVLTRYTQYWKWAKVAANPPAQARNFVSNLVLLHISGVPFHKVPTRIVEAIRQIKDNGKAWQIAKEYGVRKASFSNEEMARIERELIDLEAKRAGKGLGWPQMKSLAMKIVNMTGDWYQFMEAVGKTAKIIDMMERETIEYDHKEVVRTAAGTRTVTTKRLRKATAEEAAMAAHASLFDYSLVNPSVRYLRNAPIGVPFLTFLYKAVPMMAKNFAAHPTRMIPYLALSYGLTQLVSSMTGMDDDDLEALKKALPVWLQDKNHTYCLPFKDDRGRWQFVDLGYFFPWTAVADMAQNLGKGEFGKFLSTSGILGGPIPSLISAIQTNVDPFTKKQIIDKTATPSQQAGQLMGYLYQLNMPTWLTNNGVAGKMMQAMGNEVDKYGDPKATWAQAGLRLGGVNLYAVEPTRSRERNIKTMEGELTSLKREKFMELKNPKLTAADRANIIKEYGKELDKKKSEIDEYKKASQLSPAALS